MTKPDNLEATGSHAASGIIVAHERAEGGTAEQLLRTVLDHAPVVLFALDERGVVTLAEGHGLAMAGKHPEDRLGVSALERYASNAELVRDIKRALAGEEFTAEHVVDAAVLETHYRPLRDLDGRLTGTVGVSIDVTARRRAEEDRSKMQAALLQAQKLEGLGVLAGGIAHDFNNLLSGIIGNASLARLDPTSSSNAERLEDVVLIARQAADLTRQLLGYAGRSSIEVRPLDLSQQVHDIARLLHSSVSKRVELNVELGDDLPAIEADASQLQQVVMNLVMNAAEAIEGGSGSVRVRTSACELDPAVEDNLMVPGSSGTLPAGRYVVLEVTDTGTGMSPETKARIFDPFFTTKFTGRGLGLAMVIGIVRSHRGAMRVDSAPGRGTCFQVFFPTCESVAVPPRAPSESAALRGGGTVLIVDDEEHVRSAASRILDHHGFETLGAKSGREALEIVRAHPRSIGVVLLDLSMPDLDGEETLRKLRELRAELRVVLTSGYDEHEARRRFRAEGRVAFLQKPYSANELTAKISEALAR